MKEIFKKQGMFVALTALAFVAFAAVAHISLISEILLAAGVCLGVDTMILGAWWALEIKARRQEKQNSKDNQIQTKEDNQIENDQNKNLIFEKDKTMPFVKSDQNMNVLQPTNETEEREM